MRTIAWGRLWYGMICLVLGAGAFWWGRDWIVGNYEAVALIATVFSVLAGFLVAVMALVADDRMLRRNARAAHFEIQNIRSRLKRHKYLFHLYLVVMLLAFVATLRLNLPDTLNAWLHQTMLGLSVFAFLVSFSLPSQIMDEYLRKLANSSEPKDGQQ